LQFLKIHRNALRSDGGSDNRSSTTILYGI